VAFKALASRLAVPIASATIAVALDYWATARWGMAVSPDSANYLIAAGHLARGEGYLGSYGVHLVQFPPLYPAAVAAVQVGLGIATLGAARILSLLLAAVTALLTWILAGQLSMSVPRRALTTTLVAVSPVLLLVRVFAWSEPLFIALVLSALTEVRPLLLAREGRSDQRREEYVVRLALLGITCAMAALTRVIGIVVAPSIGLALVMSRAEPASQRLPRKDVLTMVAMGSIPLLGWDILNYHFAGTLSFGGPHAGFHNPFGVAVELATALWRVMAPGNGSAWFWTGVLGTACLGAALAISALTRRGELWRPGPTSRCVLFFGLLYCLFLGASETLGAFAQAIDARFVAPLVPDMAVIVGCSPAAGRASERGLNKLGAATGLAGLLLVSLAWAISSTEAAARDFRFGLPGASSAALTASPLVRQACHEASVYGIRMSNRPDQLAFACHTTFESSPERRPHDRPGTLASVNLLYQRLRGGGKVLLVWFPDDEPTLYSLADLEPTLTVTPLRHFSEGDLLVLSRTPT